MSSEVTGVLIGSGTADSTAAPKAQPATGTNQRSELVNWLIIGAALFGAFLLARSMRGVLRIAGAFFWVWFWTHGAWRWIF